MLEIFYLNLFFRFGNTAEDYEIAVSTVLRCYNKNNRNLTSCTDKVPLHILLFVFERNSSSGGRNLCSPYL